MDSLTGSYLFSPKQDKPVKFSGYVMRGDLEVAEIKDDEIVSVSENAPLQLRYRKDFNEWLHDRGADLSRSYLRTILRQLGLPLQNINKAVRYVKGASVTDSFWIREMGSALKYKDIKFSRNEYFNAALKGDPDIYSRTKEPTPEITNIGSYNKGWKLIGNEWFMFKAGNSFEIFSEIFTSKLAVELGLDAVEYRCMDGYAACENFVEDGWDFEPAKSLVGDNVSYDFNVPLMQSKGLLKPYIDLIFMDALVRNGDRHEFNYGFLTTLNGTIKLAPNFDNNLSLFWSGIPSNLERKDHLVSDLQKVLSVVPYDLPKVNPEIIAKVYEKTTLECRTKIDLPKIPLDVLVSFCMNAYRRLTK